MSTRDHAARIRQELKQKHGWTSRQISVKSKYYSLGSSISVRVNDPTIPLCVVERIAEESEVIHRDQYGDILGGGNRYVHVDYSGDAENVISAPWIEPISAAAAQVEAGSNKLQPIEGTPFLVGKRMTDYLVSLWDREKGMICESYPEHVAYTVGRMMLEASAP